MCTVFKCIVHKLKTGCQWSMLFVDIESITPPFSWQTVYYYFRKWSKNNVFEQMFQTYLEIQKDKLDTENLNLDGTHSLVKKSAQSVGYQHRKKGRTSNILIMKDNKMSAFLSARIIIFGNDNNHNTINMLYYDANDTLTEYSSFTSTFEYNSKNYPTSEIRTYVNGNVVAYDYEYF